MEPKIWKGVLLFVLVVGTFLSSLRNSKNQDSSSGTNSSNHTNTQESTLQVDRVLQSLNTSIDPCDDFYEFACGGWQKNESDLDEISSTALDKQAYKITETVLEILNEEKTDNELPSLSIAKDYYHDCVKAVEYTNSTDKELQFMWNKLEDLGGFPILYEDETWNSSRFDWMKALVVLRNEFSYAHIIEVLSLTVTLDNQTIPFIQISKPTLSVLGTSTYLKYVLMQDRVMRLLSDTIVNIVKKLLRFAGRENIIELYMEYEYMSYIEDASYDILIQLGKLHNLKQAVTGQKPEVLTVEDFQTKLDKIKQRNPAFDVDVQKLLNLFYADTGSTIEKTQWLLVHDLDYVTEVLEYISTTKSFLVANVMQYIMVLEMIRHSNCLLEDYNSAGLLPNISRNFECALRSERYFSAALGHAYLKKSEVRTGKILTSDTSFLQVSTMYANIKTELAQLVSASNKSDEEKEKFNLAIEKTKLCPSYPAWILSEDKVQEQYAELNAVTNGKTNATIFLERMIEINKWFRVKQLKDTLNLGGGCPLTFFPGGVVPFYMHPNVYAPYGFLQPPFYSEESPRVVNYGKAGSVLGHELAHGLPKFGVLYYENGTFTPMSSCIKDEYQELMDTSRDTSFTPRELEENVCDNIGLRAAYLAYQTDSQLMGTEKIPYFDGYNNERLFFVAFAQNWCGSMSAKLRTLIDRMYSPNKIRVLGALKLSKEFSEAWNCPVGSNMNPSRPLNQPRCNLL